jgi:hypothetical protein
MGKTSHQLSVIGHQYKKDDFLLDRIYRIFRIVCCDVIFRMKVTSGNPALRLEGKCCKMGDYGNLRD